MILRGFAIGTPSGDRTLDTLGDFYQTIWYYQDALHVISASRIIEISMGTYVYNMKRNGLTLINFC